MATTKKDNIRPDGALLSFVGKESSKENVDSPLMKQFNAIKERYPDALLLFRVGDFYETFNDDAITIAQVLDIVLTKRNDIALSGFAFHQLDNYLPKLVRAGKKVAICEQLEDPKQTKSIVKRGVTDFVLSEEGGNHVS